MKTAAVIIETWKLPIFKRHLDAAGYSYTEDRGLTNDTLVLKLEFEWVREIMPIIEAADAECKKITDKPKTCLTDGSAPSP